MNKSEKIELLSPAGSLDALKQAIHNGADAVYLGGTHFGARAYANNFDNDGLKDAVDYAHLYGTKIYVTVNTLIYESEIAKFKKYIEFLANIGVDALIMQDIGMAHWAINSFDIPVHSSTQMHNYSISNIEYLKDNGFQRAVAARETCIDDISKMSKIMETEIFAHGALCICYSGQCLFSAIELGRSGNRGRCAQACRMRYSLYADDTLMAENKYLLSPKDLGMLEDTEEIIKVNAGSIKLEGRMKSPQYVGFITKTYRNIIDNFYAQKPSKISAADADTLKRLFNRGFTKGYAFGLDNKTLMTIDRPNHAGVHIGDVISTTKEFITIKLHKPLHQGDGVKFDKADKGFVCNKIYYKGNLVSAGDAPQTIQLDNKLNLKNTDKLLLTQDINLLKSLDSYDKKKIPVNIQGEFYIDKPCKITITDDCQNTVSTEGAVVQQGKNAPLTKENIMASLSKLGDTAYFADSAVISMDENIFLNKSNTNKLRRDAVDMLNAQRTKTIEYNKNEFNIAYDAPLPSPYTISCTVTNEAQLKKVMEHKVDMIYVKSFELYEKCKVNNHNIYYFLDSLNGNIENYIDQRLVVSDPGGIKYAKNNIVISDYMLNVTNSHSLAHMNINGVQRVCLSVELDNDNIKRLTTQYKQSYGNLPNAQLLVYGRIQLMALKHCMLEGHIECSKCRTSNIVLMDIKGNSFPVSTDNKCRNYIYSKEPIDKLNSIEYLKSLGVNGFRLDFLHESPQEIEMILGTVE